MKNCLKTQLKSVVDLVNPQYLGKVLIKVTFLEGVSGKTEIGVFANIRQEHVTILSPGDVEVVIKDNGSGYLNITPVSANTTVSFLLDKYQVTAFTLSSNSNIKITVDQLLTCPNIVTVDLGYVNRGITTKDLLKLKKLRVLDASNYSLTGTLSDIAKITSLNTLKLTYTAEVTGDLSEIKDMPNLTTVTINNARVTDHNNTVEYMQNRGITVSYTPRS